MYSGDIDGGFALLSRRYLFGDAPPAPRHVRYNGLIGMERSVVHAQHYWQSVASLYAGTRNSLALPAPHS